MPTSFHVCLVLKHIQYSDYEKLLLQEDWVLTIHILCGFKEVCGLQHLLPSLLAGGGRGREVVFDPLVVVINSHSDPFLRLVLSHNIHVQELVDLKTRSSWSNSPKVYIFGRFYFSCVFDLSNGAHLHLKITNTDVMIPLTEIQNYRYISCSTSLVLAI